MATLTAKRFGRRIYYYLRECQRVDGRPKIVRQVYLGRAEDLLRALRGEGGVAPRLRDASVHEFGAVAALYDMAVRLELLPLLDRHLPKRGSAGVSVGTYVLLAALNRALAPRSKARLASWYEGTILPRLLRARPSQLSSQRFWDHMDRVSEEDLQAISEELTARVVRDFNLDLRCLLYDATNFFTYIDSFNDASTLAQRGHSKEGRDNLRILGLALLVTREEIPLFYRLYPGNRADAPTFRSVLETLVERYRQIAGSTEDITLVFDKGNNARETVENLDRSPYHFVGSLVPTQHPDLLAIPRHKLRPLASPRLESVRAYRTTKEVLGAPRTVLVTFNEGLYDAQIQTLEREIAKRSLRLRRLQGRLSRWARGTPRGPAPTVESTRKLVAKILRGRHMKELFRTRITTWRTRPRLRFRFDHQAWTKLDRGLLGKTLLFTDQDSWTDEEIVLAYRGQTHVENCFRQMKNPYFLAFRPTWHWTDQKLRVHAFYCVLALLLSSLLRRELARHGMDWSISRLLGKLGGIREVLVLSPGPKGRPRSCRALTALDPDQAVLMKILDLGRYAVS